jgi:hypothetical protein
VTAPWAILKLPQPSYVAMKVGKKGGEKRKLRLPSATDFKHRHGAV